MTTIAQRVNDLPDPARKVGKTLIKNAPTITTAAAIVGVAGVTVLSARAGTKASEILRHERINRKGDKDPQPITKKEAFKLTWKVYIPTVVTLGLTVSCIIALNRVGEKRAASAATLYAVSETAFREYREKVIEKLGEEGEGEIQEAVTQSKVDKNPLNSEVVFVGDDVLIMDSYSGRYFMANVEDIRSYVNDINSEVIGNMYASLTEFYDMLGLEPTASSDDVGWNSDNLLEVTFSPAMATKNRPCLVLNYESFPVTGYDRFL